GRDPAADIIIGDPSISRRQAELVLLDDRRIFVRDLGGANATVRIRAGQRVTVQREIVSPGDDVSFGDVVLSFDALKEMMLEKLRRAPAAANDGDAGSAAHAQQGGPAQGAIDARDARGAAPGRDRADAPPAGVGGDSGGSGAGG